jgi:hypothetical protein
VGAAALDQDSVERRGRISACSYPLTPTKSEKGLPKEQKRRKILSYDLEKTEGSSF